MTGSDQQKLAWVIVALLIVFLTAAAIAEARPRKPLQLILAQAAIGECGWHMPDCEAAVWHTLKRRRDTVLKKRTLGYVVERYCSVFRTATNRTKWVLALSASGGAPKYWPKSADWENHEKAWLETYDRAGRFIAGEVDDPCKGKPVHTGGLMDRGRMNPRKWQEVSCGDTQRGPRRQFFYELRSKR